MKTSRAIKFFSQIKKVFWITFAWIIISLSQFYIGYSSLLQFKCEIEDSDPIYYLKGSILTGLLAGIIGGSCLVFIWEKWLRSKNYGVALAYIFLTYILIFLLVSISNDIYFFRRSLDVSIFESLIYEKIIDGFFDLGFIQSFITWLFVVIGTLIALQISDKYGPGVFRSFLLGKYFQPQREERIFMFLDLRSSTTIAEKLGEERYFYFIKKVFKDVTPAIIYSKGEIYQYVGDEIVVSWKMKNGIENANCVNCFFEVQSILNNLKNEYEASFDGITPEFKAGLHYGHVMAGEVGVVKRDIAYSGDVLNTTARIQSKCNELGVNILFSKYLLDQLNLKSIFGKPNKIGEMLLRGKEQTVILYTV